MRFRFLFFAGILFLLTGAPSARAEPPAKTSAAPVVAARAGVHSDFDRLVFDWPRGTQYKITRNGTRVTISFSSAGRVDFRDITTARLSRMHDFSASTDKQGHLVISFTVDAKSGLKDFTSGKSIVIDARAMAAAPVAKKVETKPTASTTSAVAKTAEAKSAKEKKPEAKPVEKKEPEKKEPEKKPVPAVTPAVTSPVAAGPSEAPKLPPVIVSPPVTPSLEDTAPAPLPEPSPPKVEAAPPTETSSPTVETEAKAQKTGKDVFADIGTASQLVVSLDPKVSARAAIYQRAGYAYIVFDRKFTFDVATLTAGQPPPLVDLAPLDMPKASGWRFAVPNDAEIRATREGTVWRVFVSKTHVEIPVSTALVAQPDFALGARYLLPMADAPDPINFTDPVVGDRLIIVPLADAQAFSVARLMADFRILPAAQGLVIDPISDKLVVRDVSDGIEITAEGGLRLSTAHDTGASRQSSQKTKAAASGKSLFDFIAWRGKPNETFSETRQRLQQTIVDVPEAERNRSRLELARFYFANGNGEEAVALLRYLALMVPDLSTHADFKAITGASKILAYQPEDGLADLNDSDLHGQPEIELWEAVAYAEMRNWAAAEEKFVVTETILAGYPEPFYSKFAILAVESALATGKDREGKDWLDRLENGRHSTAVDPAIEYLHGVIHGKEGRTQAAADLWKEVTESNDRLYRIRAELALLDLDVATNALTPAKAADRLEAMRFGWRGDDLELDILHRLGQFYVEAKNVKSGLNVLEQAIRLYPRSPLTPKIRVEMAEIFRNVFLGDLAPNLSAVDALTLYQQYRELMPTGTDGDSVIRNLAERLVAIDLLNQAASLLEDLIKHLQGVEKGRTGARLAAIRLLDHKPDLALTALESSNDNSYPPDLLAERQLLRAKALSEQGKTDDALDLLVDNTTKDARMLRADVLMHAQRWGAAAKNLLELVGSPPKPGETLTAQQAEWLVNCAIAYSLANDSDGLGKLAVEFSASMAPMPQGDTFRVLTQSEKSSQPKDIAAVQAKISDVDLFRGFLNAYRRKPADGAKPATTQPPDQKPAAAKP